MNHPVLPELLGTKPLTKEYTWSYPWLQLHRWQRMALLNTEGEEALGPGKSIRRNTRIGKQERVDWGTG